MRKRYGIAVFIALLGLLFVGIGKTQLPQTTPDNPAPTKQHSPTPSTIRTNDAPPYVLHVQKITSQTLSLILNKSTKQTSGEIMEKNKCTYGANGGYYMTNGKPLGLFVVEGEVLAPTVMSSAANAFLVKSKDGTLSIVHDAPTVTDQSFILQAGPYLNMSVKPSILNDEQARRVFIARTEGGEWYFVAITDPENAYLGPLLSEVPEILKNMPQGFVEALNLDGGTASAFYSKEGITFGELTPIGSFLCGK